TGASVAEPASMNPSAAKKCGVLATTPKYRGDVPSPKQTLGFDLGSRKATVRQLYRYMRVIDRNSDKVVTDTFGRTAKGTPLKYALLSTKGTVKPATLKRISRDAARLRDPDLPRGQAAAIQRRMPAILWLTGN